MRPPSQFAAANADIDGVAFHKPVQSPFSRLTLCARPRPFMFLLSQLRALRPAPRLWVRLALGFGALVGLMAIVVGLAISQFRTLAQQAEQVTQRNLQHMLLVQQVTQHAQSHGGAMAWLLTAPRAQRESIYPALDAEYAAVDKLLTRLKEQMAGTDSGRQLEAVATQINAYREVFAQVGELLEGDEVQAAKTLFNQAGQPALKALVESADSLLAIEQASMQEHQRQTQRQIRQSEWLLVSLAGIALLLSGLLAWRTTMSVVRPLERVEAAANRIASGAYDTTVTVRSGDELGRVAQAINAMSSAVAARENQIERLAFTDPLTGLPNRNRLRQMVAERKAGLASVIVMDMARLSTVNEVLGFAVGDKLLTLVSERLQNVISSTATASGPHAPVLIRLTGGVFAVMSANQTRDAVDRLRECIDASMNQPINCGGQDIDVQMVYGLADSAQGSTDVDMLLRHAEVALGLAKRDRSRWLWHVAVDDLERTRQLSLISSLRSAASAGELEMWLQPKMCLSSRRHLGMEGLVRWRHPERGYVSPAEFIPFAERTGHIGVVTHAMIDAAMSRLAEWSSHRDLSIAVNISALDLKDMSLVRTVEKLARRHGAALNRLRLEITESSVMEDADRVLPVLHELRRTGVQLSIDDFGTGYSSLAYLQRLPVNELKIDRSFVAGADRNPEAQALLRTIIDLGHSMKMSVTAEGIERQEELDLLSRLGCDMAQGFLICRPLSPLAAQQHVESLLKQIGEPVAA